MRRKGGDGIDHRRRCDACHHRARRGPDRPAVGEARLDKAGHAQALRDRLQRAGHAAASLVETCKLNGVNPQRSFTDVLTRLVNGWMESRLDELMPWHWAASKNS
jgi:hypothetical protein